MLWGGGGGMVYGSGNTNSGSCGGPPIAATMTWVPNPGQTLQTDPPPKVELVEETCDTSWTSTQTAPVAGYSVSGAFGNPLPGPPATQSAFSGDKGGVKYSIQGGATLSTSETITCSVTGSGALPNHTLYTGTASVQYGSGAISAITVIPNGAIQDSSGTYNILVGQRCTPVLTGIPDALLPYTTYAWKVSGTTFQDWEPATPAFPKANPPTLANPQASYYSPGPIPTTNPTQLYWNDPKGTTETVSCTATVTLPASMGNTFSVTATQNVTVYVPTLSTPNNSVGKGYIVPTLYNNKPAAEMIATTSAQGDGSAWTASVSMPVAPNFAIGQWGYTQLVTAEEYVTLINGIVLTSTNTIKGEGLDAQFPYKGTTFYADGRLDYQGDSPALVGLNNSIKSADLDSLFRTYLMFLPPGSDSRWVPLAESYWSLNDFDAQQPNPGGWPAFPSTQTVGSVSLVYNFVPQNQFPEWTQIIDTNQPFTFN